MIDLYYYTSPNARKILIALEELGLEYNIKWTDITAGDQFAEEYVEVNPNSKVPAIVDCDGPDGRPLPLFESGAILIYLAEKTGKLLPADPVLRYETIAWVFWQVANQGPMAGQAAHFSTYAPKAGHDIPYARGRYANEINRVYKVLDDHLEDREYIVGDSYTIADIASFTWTRVAKGHGIALGDYPNVARWSALIAERPAAKVKVNDAREAQAMHDNKNYSKEQFQTLFRPEGQSV
ncbi:glutathione S-transferase family protein [Gordonia sp. OPL2]|uniref:glutathione S-transferase family protein n=1 Tax=Gordonia sp. OPL2 TaxID=2486274 RepID=UPI001654D99D|nr:glutathione S-transferase N-terminal domain-containing protein [Gordonia sp. OPL2]ROZ88022.1 glutathione S-transferase [Gordonia sp. OPL2]